MGRRQNEECDVTTDLEMVQDCDGCECRSCHNPAEEPHTCPYKTEINDDYESLCNCCSECEQECRWDI